MCGVTVSAADVVAPVFAALEIIAFLFSGVADKTGLGSFLRRFILERNDLRRVAFCDVGFAWTMTRFTAGHFVFPTADAGETGV